MGKLFTTMAVAIGLTIAGSASERAQAMPLGDRSGVSGAAQDMSIVEDVQFLWGGRNYCWYDDGWHGPGWYWCGNYLTPGLGWGGGYGWHGWRGGGRGGFRGGFRGGGRGGFRGGFGGGRGGFRGGGGRGGFGGGRGGGGRRSDVNLKHDITLLGHLDNGLGFYRFSYNGSEKPYVGVMAQEVQTVMPEAVTRGTDGYLRVYYEKVGVKFQSYDQWINSGAHVPAGTIRN